MKGAGVMYPQGAFIKVGHMRLVSYGIGSGVSSWWIPGLPFLPQAKARTHSWAASSLPM